MYLLTENNSIVITLYFRLLTQRATNFDCVVLQQIILQ